MSMKLPSLSVFFPAYNEEKNIEQTVSGALPVVSALTDDFEIIIVNDGSTDSTEDVAKKLVKKDAHVRVVSHYPNRGYGGALKRGFEESMKDWVFFSDADGQFDIHELHSFLPYIKEYDLIIGYRVKRVEGTARILNATLYKLFIFILFGLWVRDIDCAFKLIHKRVLNEIGPLWSNGAFTSAELLIKAKKKGFRIKEIGVHHYPRRHGRPTGANPKVIIRMFLEVFRLYGKLRT